MKLKKNNHKYYSIVKSHYNGSIIDTIFYRYENAKVIELIIDQSKSSYYLESTFADFNIEDKDTFKYFWCYDIISDVDDYYDVKISSISDSMISFNYMVSHVTDVFFTVTFQKRIGITKMHGMKGFPSCYIIPMI